MIFIGCWLLPFPVPYADGSLCASGGKDGVAMLWDLSEGKRLYSLDAGDVIHCLCFSPNRYWLCAATQSSIKIWDLESKSIVDDLKPDFNITSKKAQVRMGLVQGRIEQQEECACL